MHWALSARYANTYSLGLADTAAAKSLRSLRRVGAIKRAYRSFISVSTACGSFTALRFHVAISCASALVANPTASIRRSRVGFRAVDWGAGSARPWRVYFSSYSVDAGAKPGRAVGLPDQEPRGA